MASKTRESGFFSPEYLPNELDGYLPFGTLDHIAYQHGAFTMSTNTITSNDLTGILGRGAARRELECILEIASGHSSKQAAQHLGCSPSTVEKAIERLFFKLRVSNRAALVTEAFRLGLIVFAGSMIPAPHQHQDQESTNGVFLA